MVCYGISGVVVLTVFFFLFYSCSGDLEVERGEKQLQPCFNQCSGMWWACMTASLRSRRRKGKGIRAFLPPPLPPLFARDTQANDRLYSTFAVYRLHH